MRERVAAKLHRAVLGRAEAPNDDEVKKAVTAHWAVTEAAAAARAAVVAAPASPRGSQATSSEEDGSDEESPNKVRMVQAAGLDALALPESAPVPRPRAPKKRARPGSTGSAADTANDKSVARRGRRADGGGGAANPADSAILALDLTAIMAGQGGKVGYCLRAANDRVSALQAAGQRAAAERLRQQADLATRAMAFTAAKVQAMPADEVQENAEAFEEASVRLPSCVQLALVVRSAGAQASSQGSPDQLLATAWPVPLLGDREGLPFAPTAPRLSSIDDLAETAKATACQDMLLDAVLSLLDGTDRANAALLGLAEASLRAAGDIKSGGMREGLRDMLVAFKGVKGLLDPTATGTEWVEAVQSLTAARNRKQGQQQSSLSLVAQTLATNSWWKARVQEFWTAALAAASLGPELAEAEEALRGALRAAGAPGESDKVADSISRALLGLPNWRASLRPGATDSIEQAVGTTIQQQCVAWLASAQQAWARPRVRTSPTMLRSPPANSQLAESTGHYLSCRPLLPAASRNMRHWLARRGAASIAASIAASVAAASVAAASVAAASVAAAPVAASSAASSAASVAASGAAWVAALVHSACPKPAALCDLPLACGRTPRHPVNCGTVDGRCAPTWAAP